MGVNAIDGSCACVERPAGLDDDLALPDGKHLRVRALRRGEEGPIRDLDAGLSPRTRYQRFLSPLPALPDSLIRALACVDDHHQVALVAEYHDGERWEVAGLASFAAIDDFSVEVAIVIRDEWQHQRVGTELAGRLLQAAECRGYHRFIAWVQADNLATRRLLKHVGQVVSARASGGVSELAFVRRPLTR